jgi:hypothetical protein
MIATMLGRLGWHGQCSCCNAPRSKRQTKAEEERLWRSEAADEGVLRLGNMSRPGTMSTLS